MLYLEIAAGLVLLFVGGELLVRSAVAVATRLGVSPLVIGLTLVGFGTSMPELVTSVQAALVGAPDLALGNVVGSNTANILLIVGVAALAIPLGCNLRAFRRDGTVMVASTLVVLALVQFDLLTQIAGLALFAALVVYTVATIHLERSTPLDPEVSAALASTSPLARRLHYGLGLLFVAVGITVLGAHLLVEGAIVMARSFGISEAVIGVTIVAIGTSLPELATSAMAALRRQPDVALGNVIGSCIYNLLGILGLTAAISPLDASPEIQAFDIWVMTAATAALVLVVVTGRKVTRFEGAALLAAYAGYLGYLAVKVL